MTRTATVKFAAHTVRIQGATEQGYEFDLTVGGFTAVQANRKADDVLAAIEQHYGPVR